MHSSSAGCACDAEQMWWDEVVRQLNLLQQAGLIESRREGRSIIYSACFDQVSDLIVYLLEDCCAGEPCVASSVQAAADRALCCAPTTSTSS